MTNFPYVPCRLPVEKRRRNSILGPKSGPRENDKKNKQQSVSPFMIGSAHSTWIEYVHSGKKVPGSASCCWLVIVCE